MKYNSEKVAYKLFMRKFSSGTPEFSKAGAMRFWIGLWQFENQKSLGLLEFLAEA